MEHTIVKLSAILKCHVMPQNIVGSVWEKIIINNYSQKWRGILVLVHTPQKTKYLYISFNLLQNGWKLNS